MKVPVASSRRILMCVCGTSPAVVTETLYTLLTQAPSFVPDEIHVVTTQVGKAVLMAALLAPGKGEFHRLMQDYLPGRHIRFDSNTVHVISATRPVPAELNPWGQLMPTQTPQDEEVELADITNDAENQAAADTIYRVMREIKAAPGTVLHASVAGGRKSMSFYMGHAFSLLADPQDVLSHVLVSPPFETVRDFYFPPRIAVDLGYSDNGVSRTICTDQAEVKLAELSVLRLGGLLGKDWPPKAQTSFAFAVRLAQAALVAPELRVVLNGDKKECYLEVCGETIKLPPLQFTVFALYALVRCYQAELPDGAVLEPEELPSTFWEALGEDFAGGRFNEKPRNFTDVRSKVQKALREAVGPVAQHFRIEVDGGQKKLKGLSRPVYLNAPPGSIKLVGLDGWRRQLKKVLAARARE